MIEGGDDRVDQADRTTPGRSITASSIEYVALAMAAGIDKAITIYTPLPWANRFRYLDEPRATTSMKAWPPESHDVPAGVACFSQRPASSISQRKGWLEQDLSRASTRTQLAQHARRDQGDQGRIRRRGGLPMRATGTPSSTACWTTTRSCTARSRTDGRRGAVGQRARRPPTTSAARHPCRIRSSSRRRPRADGSGWYAAAYGYDGFLRWAYDAWPADPVRDARHVLWPAGDTFLVYPGADSSIRFEKLREGIVDFEKIRIVRQQRGRVGRSSDGKRLLAELIAAPRGRSPGSEDSANATSETFCEGERHADGH